MTVTASSTADATTGSQLLRRPALVGRERESRVLADAVDAAARGTGSAVVVLGEAGVGKSRLLAEGIAEARDRGLRVLRGRASATSRAIPYRPLAEAVLGVDRDPAHDRVEPAAVAAALGRLLPRHADRHPAAPDSPLLTGEAVLGVLRAASRRRGCVLALEDLHDAGAETVAAVEYLLDHVGATGTLVLVTARPDDGAAVRLARSAGRRRAATVIDLGRLTDAESDRLAAECLGAPVAALPERLLARLRRDGDGNPFVVEEVIATLLDRAALTRRHGRWLLTAADTAPPATVVACVADRAERLGPAGRRTLRAAALLGRQFPHWVAGVACPDEPPDRSLRAAVAAHLAVPDETRPGWYVFRHALTADALSAALDPAERADLSRRLADEIERRHPDLPDTWCLLTARLRLAAGRPLPAARLYAEAGRRALAGGATTSALTLLTRARHLVREHAADSPDDVDITSALALATTVDGDDAAAERHLAHLRRPGAGISGARLGALLVDLAQADADAGRWHAARARVDEARDHVTGAAPGLVAAIDALDGLLTSTAGGRSWRTRTRRLANRAARAATETDSPAALCQALELLAMTRREDDRARAHLEHVLALADRRGLTRWRVRALARLGVVECIHDGGVDRLAVAHREALAHGDVRTALVAAGHLAMGRVLRGEHAEAVAIADRDSAAVDRLRLVEPGDYLTLVRAVSAAHRGRRDAADAELRALTRPRATPLLTLASGLATAVCSLAEGDVDRARTELARTAALERSQPHYYGLSGTAGLGLLLRAVDGSLDRAALDAVAAAPRARLRWNRQFVLAADAVLLGRGAAPSAAPARRPDGNPADAAGAVDPGADPADPGAVLAAALAAAECFPLGRHLVLWLVARAAVDDRWGDPGAWAAAAEHHFHRARLPGPAAACRAIIRATGAATPQRRAGWQHVPGPLRALGVTVREHEVLRLLAEPLTNRRIGETLHISTRTVEKHVASLLAKTGRPDRAALRSLAADDATPPG